MRSRKENDPKLCDRGVRRGTCMVGGKAAVEAGAVTRGAVRCSAWFGDWSVVDKLSRMWNLAAADWTDVLRINGYDGSRLAGESDKLDLVSLMAWINVDDCPDIAGLEPLFG